MRLDVHSGIQDSPWVDAGETATYSNCRLSERFLSRPNLWTYHVWKIQWSELESTSIYSKSGRWDSILDHFHVVRCIKIYPTIVEISPCLEITICIYLFPHWYILSVSASCPTRVGTSAWQVTKWVLRRTTWATSCCVTCYWRSWWGEGGSWQALFIQKDT